MRTNSKFRFFADRSHDAWGFGIMVTRWERFAALVIGPFSFGIEW